MLLKSAYFAIVRMTAHLHIIVGNFARKVVESIYLSYLFIFLSMWYFEWQRSPQVELFGKDEGVWPCWRRCVTFETSKTYTIPGQPSLPHQCGPECKLLATAPAPCLPDNMLPNRDGHGSSSGTISPNRRPIL